jgi:ACS family hexuronate transporter-like MFS transporter
MAGISSLPATRVRWWILALLFLATTINYLDRIAFGFLIPEIRKDVPVDEITYGRLTFAFEIAYTAGFLLMGKFVDRFGTRVGYAVSIAWWSAAALLHAAARSAMGLGVYRALLGLGESGNFPAAIKSVSEWFPKKDRAFATGIFNAGTNVASMVGPPVFAAMVGQYGWRGCFLVTGSLGFVWLVLWLYSYRRPEEHSSVNIAERSYILSGQESSNEPAIGWVTALGVRETWGFSLAKFLSDPVWRFYSYWLPVYLYDARGFDMKKVAWVLPFIYLMADIGSVAGGWLSGFLLRRGYSLARARKAAMGVCAACMPLAVTAVLIENPVVAVLLMSLATAAHQGFSANLFTTASDVFPRPAVGSVTGIGGCAGGVGSLLFATLLPGYLIPAVGYKPIFLAFGTFHLSGLLVLHLLMGDLQPVRLQGKSEPNYQ